jgi:geranylgeranyl diphosphate synthase type II
MSLMQPSLENLLVPKAATVAGFLERHFSERLALQLTNQGLQPDVRALQALPLGLDKLLESVRYSVLQPGGKRFRPVLAQLTAEAMGYSAERVLPYAAAVECVHTYSLVHDDIPAMDNDDYRRGQPTNHKVFGDATAILAGDALLTEAFYLITSNYRNEPKACLGAVEELSLASGLYGMVGGQAIDLRSKANEITFEELQTMHRLKTGALIRAAAVGAAHLCFGSQEQIQQIRTYASALGLAFQVADDLLDHNPEKPEPGSYPALLGVEQTKAHLGELTERCLTAIESWGSQAVALRELANFNRQRMH